MIQEDSVLADLIRRLLDKEVMVGFYSRTIFPRICEWLLDNPHVAEHRQRTLAGVSGDVLEIGFGTGLNLPHYPGAIRKITVVDPNVGMHRWAARRIAQSGIEVIPQLANGEDLPFPAESFDCVVSTFTLCSIANVERALGEVYRVLRSGGQFLFLEHGLSPEPTVQKWQRRLNWLEMRMADGCRLDRDIKTLISAQPFSPIRVAGSYLSHTPRTHGYLYRGLAIK